MLKEEILKKIFINALLISLIGIIIFSIVAYWDFALIIGWIFGLVISLFAFLAKDFLSKRFFKKTRKKTHKKRIILGILYSMAFLIYYASLIIILVEINFAVAGKILFVDRVRMSIMYGPINIFTFLAGLHVIILSIFITGSRKTKQEKQILLEIDQKNRKERSLAKI